MRRFAHRGPVFLGNVVHRTVVERDQVPWHRVTPSFWRPRRIRPRHNYRAPATQPICRNLRPNLTVNRTRRTWLLVCDRRRVGAARRLLPTLALLAGVRMATVRYL